MGFFDKIKDQFRKVIEWEDPQPDEIVYKYPLEKKEEIMRNSVLVVAEGQKALFIQEGKLADVFEPGSYKLDDIKNIPILTKLYNWKFAWQTPYVGDVFFISTRQFINQKWGTSNPVIMRDQDFGMVRVRGFGTYSFSVGVPTLAMSELFGGLRKLKVNDVNEYFKRIITSSLSTAIAESQIPALDLSMNYEELSDMAKLKVASEFDKIGMKLSALIIENLSLPEEVEKMMDKRTSVGVMSDSMRGYAQMESIGAMRDAANNPGGMAGMGVGLGAGLGMGKMFTEQMSSIKDEPSDFKFCSECGAKVKKSAKFCPECGKSFVSSSNNICPKCGIKVEPGAKFCPECGEKLR